MILEWLEKESDATASFRLERLKAKATAKYEDKQLRSLQRRIGEWRFIVANLKVTGIAKR